MIIYDDYILLLLLVAKVAIDSTEVRENNELEVKCGEILLIDEPHDGELWQATHEAKTGLIKRMNVQLVS